MTTKLDSAKKRLDEERYKISLKEQRLKEREKKEQFKQLLDIGRLASKANIDTLDKKALLGAFLEISQKKEDASALELWQQAADKVLFIHQNELVRLTIKFKENPSKDILDKLKSMDFKWNRFLKVYYGNGSKEEICSQLRGVEYKIEEIE